MKRYLVASEAGQERYGAAVGETVELDLTDEQETALRAAGWLDHKDWQSTTKKEDKEG